MPRKKCSGPNIPAHALVHHGRHKELIHASGTCKSRIVQPVKDRNGTPAGRPHCSKCQALVGKKAWRQVEDQMNRARVQPPDGYVVAEVVRDHKLGDNRGGLYKIFNRRKELQVQLDITAKEAAKLQKILDGADPERLREIIQQEAPELAGTFEVVMKKAARLPMPAFAAAPNTPYPEPVLGNNPTKVNVEEGPVHFTLTREDLNLLLPVNLYGEEHVDEFCNALSLALPPGPVARMHFEEVAREVAVRLQHDFGYPKAALGWVSPRILNLVEAPPEPEEAPYPPGFLGNAGPQVNTTERPGKWMMKIGGCMLEVSKDLFEIDDIVKFENGARGLPAKFHVDHLRDLIQALADEITDECGTSPVQVLWKRQGLLIIDELPAPEPQYNEDADDVPF